MLKEATPKMETTHPRSSCARQQWLLAMQTLCRVAIETIFRDSLVKAVCRMFD